VWAHRRKIAIEENHTQMAKEKRVIALGFFDGVHLGHAALLKRTVERAGALRATPAVLTFDTHPGGVVTGDRVPLINTLDGRIDLIERLHGIRDILVLPFDEAFRSMLWADFVEVLQRDYGAVHLICGHNYYFGHRGEGTPQRLMEKCRALGIGVDVIPEVSLDGVPVSSTYIRTLLQVGEMERARRFLGHPHTLLATVQHGYKLGRSLGVPTTNMEIPDGVVIPRQGVHATRVFLPDSSEGYRAVTNVGLQPTLGRVGGVTVETYILGFDGDLYGKEVRVEFYRYQRPEVKFDDLAALKAQIQEDVLEAKAYFDRFLE